MRLVQFLGFGSLNTMLEYTLHKKGIRKKTKFEIG